MMVFAVATSASTFDFRADKDTYTYRGSTASHAWGADSRLVRSVERDSTAIAHPAGF